MRTPGQDQDQPETTTNARISDCLPEAAKFVATDAPSAQCFCVTHQRLGAREQALSDLEPGGTVASVPVVLCVLIWARPGEQDALTEYEDRALALLPAHGARVLTRVRALDGQPDEVQILEFPTDDALRAFLDDPARAELATLRERALADTQILRVDPIA